MMCTERKPRMNRRLARALTVTALVLAAVALTGCSALAEPGTEMGEMTVWGYVASERYAQLEIAEDQEGAETLVVDRVLAPEDAWVVVHLDDDGAPGERIGLTRVEEGESTDVEVELDAVTTPKVIVALHADRGMPGEFDFDMDNMKMSPDRPFFVEGEELARVVTIGTDNSE
jgi:hypothetical protein